MATETASADGARVAIQGGHLHLLDPETLDGRTKAARSIRDLQAALIADAGGERNTSASQHELAQRIAVLAVMLESMETAYLTGHGIDLHRYLPAANAFRRLVVTFGVKRRTVTPELASYTGGTT